MASGETNHIGDKTMLIVQSQIRFLVDKRVAVPAERFQRFLNKLTRLRFRKVAFRLMQIDQFQTARGKNRASGQNIRSTFTQRHVFNKLQPEQ
ncbi:hypothetical protein D3C72_2238060 [compost metagenome]